MWPSTPENYREGSFGSNLKDPSRYRPFIDLALGGAPRGQGLPLVCGYPAPYGTASANRRMSE
jgi:hypothetical protein